MNDHDALLAAYRADPAEMTTLLVLADWLDENARHNEAEFLRILVTLVRGELIEAERNRLLMRRQRLLEQMNNSWLLSFGSPLFLSTATFPVSVEETERQRLERERQQLERERLEKERREYEAATKAQQERQVEERRQREHQQARQEAFENAIYGAGNVLAGIGLVLLWALIAAAVIGGVGLAGYLAYALFAHNWDVMQYVLGGIVLIVLLVVFLCIAEAVSK